TPLPIPAPAPVTMAVRPSRRASSGVTRRSLRGVADEHALARLEAGAERMLVGLPAVRVLPREVLHHPALDLCVLHDVGLGDERRAVGLPPRDPCLAALPADPLHAPGGGAGAYVDLAALDV